MPAKVKDTLELPQIAKMYGMPDPEDVDMQFGESEFSMEIQDAAYKQAIDDGHSEEEAEQIGMDAEVEARGEEMRKVRDAMVASAERLLEKHGLELAPVGKDPRNTWTFKVIPTHSWEEAAAKIMQTINGVGQFEFNSLRDFLESGPYTPRQAVLSHLHWTAYWPEVYGEKSAERYYYDQMRY
jgi:hypothetical protein